ncbi:MAG: HesB/IscA family protein [Rhodanobacteraceae bacterium]
MSIELTPAAAARVRDFLAANRAAPGVRFGIKRTGCSGFGYTVDLAREVTGDDKVFDLDGIKLVVDAKALPFVDGTRIDYARDGLNAAFVFHNPNATAECGCGESFTVEEQGIGDG